jgi:uncharacterized RDD family membrane protein YckC/ribosomal protein L28
MSNQSDGTEYSGFWARVAAYIVDSACIFAICLLLAIAFSFLGEVGVAITGGAVFLIQLLYWPVLESSARQATYGKRMLGIQVEHAGGGRTTFLRALGRNLAKIISGIPLGLGFVMVAFTGRKQGLHDMIAKCVVVRVGPSHFMKALIASVVGIAVVAGSAGAFVYYIYLPSLMKDIGSVQQDAMKAVPAIKPQPPAQSAAKTAAPSTPPVAKTPAPAASAVPVAPAAPAGGDAEFERLVGAPLTGLEMPNSTRAGPAILELSTFFGSNFWLKVYLPNIKDLAVAPAPEVIIDRVLDSAGIDRYDAANTFETGSVFRSASLSLKETPVPHFDGIRSVRVVANTKEQSVQKVEGRIRIVIPVNVQVAAFAVEEAGKVKTVHGATLTLKSVSGNGVVMHYRGPSAQLLTLRGFGKDGKPVATESRQTLQENQNVDESFQTRFQGPVSKVEAVISAGMVEREFPFSLARGMTAGAPATATAAIKPAATASGASVAPSTVPPEVTPPSPAKPAPASAAPAPTSTPASRPEKAVKAPLQPSSPPEPRQTAPKPVPASNPISKLGTKPQPELRPCIIRPAMTDAEIDNCKRTP